MKNQTVLWCDLLIGGKWWTGGDQNKPSCTSILEASGTERCFYEGTEVNDLIRFYSQHFIVNICLLFLYIC